MRPEMAFTSAAECDLIVEQALAVLEETGLRFGPCAALDERTVARLPRSVLLAGATPDDDSRARPLVARGLEPSILIPVRRGAPGEVAPPSVRRGTMVRRTPTGSHRTSTEAI